MDWIMRLEVLFRDHPLRHTILLGDPARIRRKMDSLNFKIAREQNTLSQLELVYMALIKASRYSN